MHRPLLCAVLALLAAPTFSAAKAQVLVVSQYRCDTAKVDALRAFNDTAGTPLWQELVNEGKMLSAGTAYARGDDEWNVVYFYTAETVLQYREGHEEAVARVTERYPEYVELWQEACQAGKDSHYWLGKMTEPPPAR